MVASIHPRVPAGRAAHYRQLGDRCSSRSTDLDVIRQRDRSRRGWRRERPWPYLEVSGR
jgi:hypothetical protein